MERFRVFPSFILAALIASSPAAFPQEFEKWEGKATVLEGDGGTKKVVDGIDFWAMGNPPRKYVLLGYISDRRHKSGLRGKISMSHLDADIAKVAKEAGGDAVILVDSQTETTGVVGVGNTNTQAHAYGNRQNAYGSSNSFSIGSARAVQKQDSRFAVIKYVNDEPPQAPPNTEQTAPPH